MPQSKLDLCHFWNQYITDTKLQSITLSWGHGGSQRYTWKSHFRNQEDAWVCHAAEPKWKLYFNRYNISIQIYYVLFNSES